MCGIMGFVRTGPRNAVTDLFIHELYTGIEIRGSDAGGFAAFTEKQHYILRAPLAVSDIARDERFTRTIMEAKLFIGHARYATHGDPKFNRNNHPFVSNDVRYSVVHNGIYLANLPGYERKSECDSEILMRVIERHGLHAGKEMIDRHGTRERYACLGIDSATRELFAFRNDNAPLVICNYTKQVGIVAFASTADIMLTAAFMVFGRRVGRPESILPYDLVTLKSSE